MSRAVPAPLDLTPLQDLLRNIQDQLGALWQGQDSTNRMLNDLSARDHEPTGNLPDRLRGLENAVQQILNNLPQQIPRPMPQPGPPMPVEEEGTESPSESAGDIASILNRLRDMAQRAVADEQPYIRMPTAQHAGPTLDEMLLRTLAPQYVPSPPVTAQPPPPLVSLQYRPRTSTGRARSVSPTFEFASIPRSPPARVRTVPEPQIRRFQPPPRSGRRTGRTPSLSDSIQTQPEFPPPPPPPSVIPQIRMDAPGRRPIRTQPSRLGDAGTRVSIICFIVHPYLTLFHPSPIDPARLLRLLDPQGRL